MLSNFFHEKLYSESFITSTKIMLILIAVALAKKSDPSYLVATQLSYLSQNRRRSICFCFWLVAVSWNMKENATSEYETILHN